MGRRFIILALAAAASGCPSPSPEPPATAASAPTADALALQIKDLQGEIMRLKGQMQVLEQDKEYLNQREEKLSAEARYLKFINEQQAKQLKALADAPSQRDYYRNLAERLAGERETLLKQIADLRRQAGVSATAPAE